MKRTSLLLLALANSLLLFLDIVSIIVDILCSEKENEMLAICEIISFKDCIFTHANYSAMIQ